MIAEGLLWFDDDTRRSVSEKIAHAIERYSERTGWRPSVCETHPTLVEAYNVETARAAERANSPKRASKAPVAPPVELPAGLKVIANPAVRPNCFLIGIAPGERPRKAAPANGHAVASRATSRDASKSLAPAPRASRKKAS